jgi:hypothetical protein
MRPKKSKEPKKYAVGGMVAAGLLGAGQAGLGIYQMIQGQQAAKRIKEASTARPSEYAELLKQARNAEVEQRRLEELNRSIATGIAAAQQGGGRALVGALPGMVRAGDAGALDILGQRQAQTMQALQFGAQGAEREIGREINREMMERGAAQAALEGGLQNIAGGLGQVGSAAIYGSLGRKGTAEDTIPAETQETAAVGQQPAMIAESDTESVLREAARLQREADAQALLAEEDFMMEPIRLQEGGMITGGKFDHKTNPIDIIHAGRKVGEMTGGEVILNLAQQKKLSKESAYFRTLLKKFNKQK